VINARQSDRNEASQKDENCHIQTSTVDQTMNKGNTAEGIAAIHST